MNYCMFCGFHLDKSKCANCCASFEVKLTEGTAKVRITGRRRLPIRSLRRFSSEAAVCSLN